MPSSQTIIAIAVGAAIVGGTAAFLTSKRLLLADVVENDEDDVFKVQDASGVKFAQKTTPTLLTTTAAEKDRSDIAKIGDPSNDLLNEALKDFEMQGSNATSGVTTTSPPTKTVGSAEVGKREEFPSLGVSLTVPRGWEIRDDPSPLPNVAMLTVWNQELVPEDPRLQQPGVVPMIVLTIEDIHGDNINLTEFKERCKDLALEQMLMMSGGAVQPKVTKNNPVKEGDFRYVLEYVQSLPPFYELLISNYLEVRSGLAYTFQIMCAPSVMPQYSSMFLDIVRSVRIGDISPTLGYVEVRTGTVKVNIDTTWSWEFGGKDSALAVFTTTSSVKTEEVRLYKEDQAPTSTFKPRNTKIVNEVEVVSAYDGEQEEKLLTYNGYRLVVKPLQKTTSYLMEDDLVAVIRSVSPCTEPPRPSNGATFVNPDHGYQIDVVGGSRLVASRIGGGTVAYVPQGFNQGAMEEERLPTLTIRVGSPEDDPDCMETLDAWEERINQEAKENDIKNIHVTTINDEPCLVFTTNAMEEIAPGRRSEVRGKVFIFMRGRKTILLRWEMGAGLWRKFQGNMNEFMESLKFI